MNVPLPVILSAHHQSPEVFDFHARLVGTAKNEGNLFSFLKSDVSYDSLALRDQHKQRNKTFDLCHQANLANSEAATVRAGNVQRKAKLR